MFSTLEATWDRSARRRLSTLASFIFQGLALSLLFAIPLIWVQAPPLLHFLDILPASAPQPPGPMHAEHSRSVSQMPGTHLLEPPSIPITIAPVHDTDISAPPDLGSTVERSTGPGVRNGFFESIGNSMLATVRPPTPPPQPSKPLKISHMAEGSLVYRVQPEYPEIARAAHIQGAVRLRAIISKAGTIENLVAESGHPTLIPPAMQAVKQWRYRPYLLNGEPVEVETEITVNFVLGG